VHYVRDISNLSIFEDNSVDLIYASHCLEHFHYNEIQNILQEWHRVLKKGGILRLSVPDFDLLLNIFHASDRDPDSILPQLLGGQNNRYNFHYTVFNKQNLTKKLLTTGFENIREWMPGTNSLTTFNDFSVYFKEINGIKYPVSLNLEACKR
jgi:predicted SAM-dependent methyltransferase